MDSLHKNSQRIFVLNRVEEIWGFEENEKIETLEEAIENSVKHRNVIYPKLPSSHSTIDEDIDEAIGNSFEYNFCFFKTSKLVSWVNLSTLKDWVLGELLPLLFNLGTFILSFFAYVMFKRVNNILGIVIVSLTALLVLFYFGYYFSQLDKLEVYNQDRKVTMEEAKNFNYKLKCRKNKKFRTCLAGGLQLIITVVLEILSICQLNFFEVSVTYFLFSIPIMLIMIITIAGLFIKIEKCS